MAKCRVVNKIQESPTHGPWVAHLRMTVYKVGEYYPAKHLAMNL